VPPNSSATDAAVPDDDREVPVDRVLLVSRKKLRELYEAFGR
jgi:hypothetical protein